MAMNTTLDGETLEMLGSAVVRITLPAVYLVIILISLPGNGISLWLLCFHTHPKTPLVTFMINLTIADILLAFFLPFQIAYHLNENNWAFGKTLCTFVTTLFYVNMDMLPTMNAWGLFLFTLFVFLFLIPFTIT
eukprot:g46400.t1